MLLSGLTQKKILRNDPILTFQALPSIGFLNGRLFPLAAREGNLELCRFILSKDSNVNVIRPGVDSALLLAVERGNFELIKLLCEQTGIDLHRRNDFMETPFVIACKGGHFDIVEFLLERFDAIQYLSEINSGLKAIISSNDGCDLIVDKLLKIEGRGLNVKGSKNESLLMWAIHKCNISLIARFMEFPEVRVNDCNSFGTPLMNAIQPGNCEICKILIECECECECVDLNFSLNHHTAFSISVEKGLSEICRFFVN
jgi:ankyrin repeat protein